MVMYSILWGDSSQKDMVNILRDVHPVSHDDCMNVCSVSYVQGFPIPLRAILIIIILLLLFDNVQTSSCGDVCNNSLVNGLPVS